MSAPPDFMTQLLQGNNPYGTNGALYSPQMGLALGLLQAGGPSRMPVSLGQALGQGLQTGQQFQQQGLQNAMQQLMLGQKVYGMQVLQDAFNPQNNNQPTALPPQPNIPAQQAPVTANVDASSATSGLNAPSNIQIPGQLQPTPAIGGKLAPIAMPSPSQVQPDWQAEAQQRMDAYQRFSKAAAITQNPQMQAYADGQRTLMQNSWHPMSDAQVQQYTGGKPIPGYGYFINELGEPKTVGTDAIKPTSVFSPQLGTMVPALEDVRGGRIVSGNVPSLSPDKPLPGPMESKAQAIASYTAAPVAENRGDPAADAVMARVRNIAQTNGDTYDATNWQNKQKAVISFGSGKLGQQTASANKAVLHLDTLSDLADNLNNTSTPAFNHLANMWKAQTGQSAPTSFEAARQVALDEVNKFIVGSSGGVSDREKMQSIISKASSPQQLADGIKTIKELMGGQLYALQKQYEASTGLHDFQKRYLFPQTQSLLQTIQSPEGAQTNTGNNGLPSGWSVQVH